MSRLVIAATPPFRSAASGRGSTPARELLSPRASANVTAMKSVCAFLFLLIPAIGAAARDFKLYVILNEDTKVELSDGAVWAMDKGDVFPLESYKNQQKDIVLRLAGATFMTETARTRILTPAEVPAGIEVYRRNVRAYLESTSKKIQRGLEPGSGAKEQKPQ